MARQWNILLLALLWSIPYGATAAEFDNVSRSQMGGVTIETRSFPYHVVFCITANDNIKISSVLGVTFDADRAAGNSWDETLPKTITGPDWDFELPFRADIKTRFQPGGSRVEIRMGACSDHCDLLKFQVRVPYSQRNEIADTTCDK